MKKNIKWLVYTKYRFTVDTINMKREREGVWGEGEISKSHYVKNKEPYG